VIEGAEGGRMNGSLQKKGLVYYVVYREGNGKQKWVSTKCKEKSKAKRVLNEIMYEIEHDTYIQESNEAFSDFIRNYFTNNVVHDVEATTFDGYINIIDNHLAPYFSDKKTRLQDIKVITLQEYFDCKYNIGLSPQTLRRHRSVLNSALEYAVDMELIRKNPIKKVKYHRQKRKEQNCYDIDEVNLLLDVVAEDVIAAAVFLAVVYGLRRSELLGLRWCDIDFEKHLINITNVRTKVSRNIEKQPKSEYSKKQFYMVSDIEKYLLLLKNKQKKDAELFGNCYNDNDYVIKYDNGNPVSIPTLNYRFKRILEMNGLRHIRLHDLRHTVATLMLQEKIDVKVVQDWMRHSSTKTLMGIYAHISPDKSNSMNSEIEQHYVSNIDSSRVRKVLEKQGKQEEN